MEERRLQEMYKIFRHLRVLCGQEVVDKLLEFIPRPYDIDSNAGKWLDIDHFDFGNLVVHCNDDRGGPHIAWLKLSFGRKFDNQTMKQLFGLILSSTNVEKIQHRYVLEYDLYIRVVGKNKRAYFCHICNSWVQLPELDQHPCMLGCR